MITEEQRNQLRKDRFCYVVLAVLTRNYKPEQLGYTLLKGTIVKIAVYTTLPGDLYINDERIDKNFPYDAAELLE